MKVRFKEGSRIYVMKIVEELENGDIKVIDGTIVEKKNIIEIIE